MSIDQILRIAVSGLNTTQSVLATTSSNIANVNTPGYVRRVAELEVQVAGTTGSGVRVAELRRVVDEFLTREVRQATADAGRYEAMATIHERVQTLLGRPDENSSFHGRLESVFEAMAGLPLEPDSLTRRIGAVQSLQDFGFEVTRIATKIQELRGEADRRVKDAVDEINDAIERIAELNPQISRTTVLGGDASALIEQRDQAVARIAAQTGVQIAQRDNNEITVSTSTGVVLVDALSRRLDYSSPGTVTSNTTFPEIVVRRVHPITGEVSATGTALDRNLATGALRGLIDMRNVDLVDFALELGEFAGRVVDEINRVHNDNSAVPPPASLTGRATGLIGTDAHGFTGQVTFAIVDSNQFLNPPANGRRIDVDFTAGTIAVNGGAAAALSGTTLADLVSDIDTALGANGDFTLSSAGALTFSAANAGEGVVIVQGTTPSERGDRGFSHFFGMNDLLDSLVEPHFDTGFTSGGGHGFGATGTVDIQLRGPSSQVATSFTLDFSALGGTTFGDVVTALNTGFAGFGTWTLDSDGALAFAPTAAFDGFTPYVTNDTTNRSGTNKSLTELFGIGDRFVADAAREVAVTSRIQAAPALLALADIDLTAGADAPALTVGDGRGALALANLNELDVTFRAAGELAGVTTTLSAYAGSLLSQFATEAELTSNLSQDYAQLRSNLEQKNGEVSGVSLDEELANLIIFQNAYNASARLITTARDMFDALLEVAR